MWHVFFLLPSAILWPAAGLAAQPPHFKEQSDAQMRLWRGVSKSMFTCFLTEDRFYNYAVKLAAVTFKRSIAAGSIFGGIDSHAWRSKETRKHVSGFLPYFLYSRGAYRFSQQQFSCAQRAQRKFRMEAGRNFGKICQKLTFCYIPLFLCFRMLIC